VIRKGAALLLAISLMSACSTNTKQTSETTVASKLSVSKPDHNLAKSAAEQRPVGESPTELNNLIKWDNFFDDEKQDKPSKKFSDLNGQDVTIDGFMGEILSLGQGWFLLIPKPGAECPFDNGDQSYWNSIMIVFVKNKDKLRYTQGALRLTGRLDVGAKKDESGYTTMFRLYDAEYAKK
jgi:hypothetical protein